MMLLRRWNHSVIRTSAWRQAAQPCGIAYSVISMDRLLRYFLDHFIRRGAMTFTTASGAKFTCGDGTGEPVAARFLTADAERRILLNPELALGEIYMDGTFVIEQWFDRRRAGDSAGPARDIAALGQAAMVAALPGQACPAIQSAPPCQGTMSRATTISTGGSIRSFSMPTSNTVAPISKRRRRRLDDAQLAKKRHVAAKLLIGPGDRVLDIGSGWGGLGLYLAEIAGANVTGVTLSTEQLQVSNARAAEKNLTRAVKFLLEDYRDIPRPVRPHRVGRNVRACRRRLLRDLFPALRRTAHR